MNLAFGVNRDHRLEPVFGMLFKQPHSRADILPMQRLVLVVYQNDLRTFCLTVIKSFLDILSSTCVISLTWIRGLLLKCDK